MIEKLKLRGSAGSVLWGYRTAAEISGWVIFRNETKVTQSNPRMQQKARPAKGTASSWQLRAKVTRGDAFQLRQRPLYFTAPRAQGFWCWPLLDVQFDGKGLVGKLGPPEQ